MGNKHSHTLDTSVIDSNKLSKITAQQYTNEELDCYIKDKNNSNDQNCKLLGDVHEFHFVDYIIHSNSIHSINDGSTSHTSECTTSSETEKGHALHTSTLSMYLSQKTNLLLMTNEEWESLVERFSIRHVRHISAYYKHIHYYKCTSRTPMYYAINNDGNRVVLKSFHAINGKPIDDQVLTECLIHILLKHPNIIQVNDCFWCKESIYLVFDEMEMNLTKIIVKPSLIPENLIRYIIFNLVSAVVYLHSKGILHRDIKSDNILIKDGCIKLADFGLSCHCTQLNHCNNCFVGSPYWMAPEVIRGEPSSVKSDVWGIGIVLLELVNGEVPYYDIIPCEALFIIAKQQMHFPVLNSDRWSTDLINFCDCCLQINPKQRYSAEELLEHRFLVEHVASQKDFKEYLLPYKK